MKLFEKRIFLRRDRKSVLLFFNARHKLEIISVKNNVTPLYLSFIKLFELEILHVMMLSNSMIPVNYFVRALNPE